MSSGYKDRLYATYLADHLAPRKGGASLEALRARAQRWDKTLAAYLPADRDAAIADLGCGYGSVVWWLQQRGYANAGGIDVSHDQIEQGSGLGVRNLRQGDVLEFLRTASAQYDLLIARDLFEHLTKEDTLEALTLCREALRPGGALLLQVPNGESPLAGRIIYGDFTHETAFTQASLSQVLRAAGFGSVACFPVRPVVYGLKSWLRSLVWRVVETAIVTAIVAEVGPVRPIVTQNLLVVAGHGAPPRDA
ncbi:MAG TPA: class I SAM-dependent methyltransferase [Gemmatimonadales bacterium]|nr:class I SAM-dependent methyltransferase [Gemmatimonadales bacterium]